MQLAGHKDTVQMAQFSPDGYSVATASRDGKAIVWDVAAEAPRIASRSLTGGGRRGAVQPGRHADRHRVRGQTARVWDARTGQPLGAPLEHDAPLLSAAFLPTGSGL